MNLPFINENTNLILDFGTTRKLATLLKNIPDDVKHISAAVAYTTQKYYPSDISIADICINKKIKLDWWGLFTSDGATSTSEITKALEHPDLITFYPFAEHFHSKVIYLHGYGVYIGSHNFTKSAMEKNVEAGVFIKENSFSEKIRNDLDSFFKYLKDRSIPAVAEDLERIQEFNEYTSIERRKKDEIQQILQNYFEDQFSYMFRLKAGVQDNSADTRDEKRLETEKNNKEKFLKEWRQTQNIIDHVRKMIQDNCTQPNWIHKDASLTVITDQILHGYFYSYLLKNAEEKKNRIVVDKANKENSGRSDEAILEAIHWWESLNSAPSNENIYINEWGISNKQILSNLISRPLTKAELLQVMLQNHAARNHARQIKNSVFNLPQDFNTDIDNRVKIYVDWLYEQKSLDGLNINDVLKYLLFGEEPMEDRIYNCIKDKHYRIEHFGRSIIGEILGWGRPDITYIRNNRVNKALRALGYDDVELFSE